MWVASKIYASIPIYFAHWQGVRDLDLDAAYQEYLKAATAAETRWDFDLLTQEFMARLKNGHTDFSDRFLSSAGGRSLGFSAVPVEGKWTVLETYIDKLKIGDVIERIGGVSMDRFYADKRKYISASSEAAAQRVFFHHKHLFPQQFRLHLASGADVPIDRLTQDPHFPEVRPTDARWIKAESIAYMRIQSFEDPKYEEFALNAARRFLRAPKGSLVWFCGQRESSTVRLTYNIQSVILRSLIRTFSSKETEQLFNREHVGEFVNIERVALRRLVALNNAVVLSDLQVPPGNRLEALKGYRDGQHSIRINDKYRICFIWKEDGAYNVEITKHYET